ncbi:MAG: hypothetical protein CMN55_13025 [Sneathiella sp.]|jgi:hypothetical protein|uniref:hypothetical protein n=1 Tax=Sneathiella sp. TaxID=1964365 RepID=UPI000C69C38A|nr:hypothetical protein [Sneathiella sp.]MAL80014.1 hypothetical protein [Sneathiella sp.]|tara:strand:- start:135 stop:800 length:666 start_codon:yes stop_codon:yes gene_type:complete
MQNSQKSGLKAKLRVFLATAHARLRASSVKERLVTAAPLIAALFMAGAVVLLDIFYRGRATDGWGLSLLGNCALLFFFFAPLTYVGVWLYGLIRPRLRERRFMDALRLGLYVPHAFAMLVILIARLEGSETIASFGSALITWAMLSLLLSPFTVLLTLLAWSFLPEDEKLAEIRDRTVQIGAQARNMLPAPGRFNARGQKLLGAPTVPSTAPDEDKDALRT